MTLLQQNGVAMLQFTDKLDTNHTHTHTNTLNLYHTPTNTHYWLSLTLLSGCRYHNNAYAASRIDQGVE